MLCPQAPVRISYEHAPLPEDAGVVDDGAVDDGRGQHGEQRHEHHVERHRQRLVLHRHAPKADDVNQLTQQIHDLA